MGPERCGTGDKTWLGPFLVVRRLRFRQNGVGCCCSTWVSNKRLARQRMARIRSKLYRQFRSSWVANTTSIGRSSFFLFTYIHKLFGKINETHCRPKVALKKCSRYVRQSCTVTRTVCVDSTSDRRRLICAHRRSRAWIAKIYNANELVSSAWPRPFRATDAVSGNVRGVYPLCASVDFCK